MKTLKKNLFIALTAGLMIFTACGEDDGVNGGAESAATIQFDGKTWTKAQGEDITLTTISFGGDSFTTIGGNVVNGTDTLSLTMQLASTAVGVYESTTDSTANSIALTPQSVSGNSFATNIFSDELLSGASYTITITSFAGSTITGEFTAVLSNGTETKTASGSFTALDFFGSFFQ